MKPSYKNRKLDGLFSYYPIEPGRFSDAYEAKLIASLKKLGAYSESTRLMDRLPGILDLDAVLGIEVEAEQVADSLILHPVHGWTVINDSSLRNGGREFITAPVTPLMAKHLIAALWASFKQHQPDFSWRTSIHVHLNMRNERVSQVINNLLLYTLFEDSLFTFIGNSRRQSNFCVPVQETHMAYYVSELLSGEETLPHVINAWSKYTALNIRPLTQNDHAGGMGDATSSGGKGTFEFRHLEGTMDAAKVINWINLLLCIQRYSRQISLEDLEERITGITTREHYMGLLREVFQDFSGLLQVRGFSNILYSAVACAKEMFCPIPNIPKLVKMSKDKQTGLSEMIKIRTRFKKEEENSIPVKKFKAVLSPGELQEGFDVPITDWSFPPSSQP